MIKAGSLWERIRDDVEFDYETAGEDDFMRLIHALEERIEAIDEAAARNARGELSAADVCSVLFHNGFGSCITD